MPPDVHRGPDWVRVPDGRQRRTVQSTCGVRFGLYPNCGATHPFGGSCLSSGGHPEAAGVNRERPCLAGYLPRFCVPPMQNPVWSGRNPEFWRSPGWPVWGDRVPIPSRCQSTEAAQRGGIPHGAIASAPWRYSVQLDILLIVSKQRYSRSAYVSLGGDELLAVNHRHQCTREGSESTVRT